MKHRPNDLWFKIHQKVQLLGVLVGIIGFSIAVKNFDVYSDPNGSTSYQHGVFGAITFALILLQTLVGLVRPGASSNKRNLWQWKHKILGYFLMILIFATILLGAKMEGTSWQLAYVFGVVGSLVLISGLMWFDRFSYQAPVVNEGGSDMSNAI